MTDIDGAIEGYIATWNETDPPKREAMIRQSWTGEGRYVDPLADARGLSAFSELIGGVQAQFPGHRFRHIGAIDSHHGCVRFAWELLAPDDTVVATGMDVAVLSPDGRFEQVIGFLGDAPHRVRT